MIIVTWNVLHRVHAVNWDEPVLAAWPDERVRSGSIADWIAESDADVVCLQEVSGDQLAMLRDVETGEIFAMRYARMPAYRKHAVTPLRELAEYLVTIVRGGAARVVAEHSFASDGGKGFLQVELADGTTVVNTHVTHGEKRTEQLARLVEAATTERVIVCGDFNAPADVIVRELGADFRVAALHEDAIATRPGVRAQTIDHVFVRGAAADATVIDGEGRSDHNPVRARVQ